MTDTGPQIQPPQADRQAAQAPALPTDGEPGARHCAACGGSAAPAPVRVDIDGWVRASWNLFVENPAAAILIPLVMLVPAIVVGVAGFLGGLLMVAVVGGDRAQPLMASIVVIFFGLVYLALALVVPALSAGIYACFRDGIRTRKLTAARLFDGFRSSANWWACTWVTGALGLAMAVCTPFVLVLVGIPALFAVSSLLWLSLLRILDRGQGGSEALSFAWNAMRGRLWMMLGFTFLMMVLQNIGVLAFGVGLLVTTPLAFGAYAAGYEAIAGRAAEIDRGEVAGAGG